MLEKKRRAIPSISADRIDISSGNTSIGSTKEDELAHAFIKGKEPFHRRTIRMPKSIDDELTEIAFKKGRSTITSIILELCKEYIKENK